MKIASKTAKATFTPGPSLRHTFTPGSSLDQTAINIAFAS
jgi:hypothetical protein